IRVGGGDPERPAVGAVDVAEEEVPRVLAGGEQNPVAGLDRPHRPVEAVAVADGVIGRRRGGGKKVDGGRDEKQGEAAHGSLRVGRTGTGAEYTRALPAETKTAGESIAPAGGIRVQQGLSGDGF